MSDRIELRPRDIDLMTRYPVAFRYPPVLDPIVWGVMVGDGWIPIIERLCDDLSHYVMEHNVSGFRITQIKEKFGDLRVYFRYDDAFRERTAALLNLTDAAAREAFVTCEVCGHPGSLERMSVRCNEHRGKWK